MKTAPFIPPGFELEFFDTAATAIEDLRIHLGRIEQETMPGPDRGLLHAMVFELLTNALRATYKIACTARGPEYSTTDFQINLERDRGREMATIAREWGLAARVRARLVNPGLWRIEVSNPGLPDSRETEALRKGIETGRAMRRRGELLCADHLGIPLILLSLKISGLRSEALSLLADGQQTIARLDLPVRFAHS